MNIFILILLVVSIGLAIVTLMHGGDNSAYVAAMLTITAIGVRGKA